MSPLSDYKKELILARALQYNSDLTSLFAYYQGLLDAVNQNASLSRSVKMSNMRAINVAKQKAVIVLKSKYKTDVYKINRIVTLPTPPPPIVRTTPKKTAVLIGINYIGTPNQLNGCINDTVVMSNILKTSHGYSGSNISFMTDNTFVKPTRANILNAFTNLLKNSISGDRLFFFYSGHGTQKANNANLNPNDKIDECIYPLDKNIITDVTFKQIIDANMKQGVNLTAVFDSCFSGTIMNLKYNYLDSDNNGSLTVDTYAAETVGQVISISGCKDDQTSEDAYINGAYDGALTWALQTTLSSAPAGSSLSWAQLMTGMRTILTSNTFTQLPQFCSGAVIDMNSPVAF